MKFVFKKMSPKFVIPAVNKVINGIQVEVIPSKRIEVTNAELDTKEFVKKNPSFTEEEVINRITGDSKYNTAEIRAITEADIRAVKIHAQKRKEAEEEIKRLNAKDSELTLKEGDNK